MNRYFFCRFFFNIDINFASIQNRPDRYISANREPLAQRIYICCVYSTYIARAIAARKKSESPRERATHRVCKRRRAALYSLSSRSIAPQNFCRLHSLLYAKQFAPCLYNVTPDESPGQFLFKLLTFASFISLSLSCA